MNLDSKWVPMKWPCGPLEAARRNKSQTIDTDLKETIEAWGQPATLGLLKGTPINCLIVEWAHGGPEDSGQQQALKPLLEVGRRLGISFVGRIEAKDGLEGAIETGRAAGLSAVLLAGPARESYALPVIQEFPRDKVAWETTSPIFSVTDNVWPGVGLEAMKEDTVMAGPTGAPWVRTNGWFSLLGHELAPGKTLWLDFDPPDSSSLARPAAYGLAVADSEAYAGRWIISLDDKLRAALPKGNPQAMGIWAKLCESIQFFENHREWRTFKTQGVLAVVSDFRGDNAFMSTELLNLITRRHVQYQIIERAQLLSAPTQGLKAIIWVDKDTPSAQQLSKLDTFTRQGGLLITPIYWGPAGVKPYKRDPSIPYNVYNVGKGEMAVPEEGFLDPFQVAGDTHMLVSHRNDLVRLYNPGTMNLLSDIDQSHKKRLIHILNYSSGPASSVVLYVNSKDHLGRIVMPGTKTPLTIHGTAASPGTEFKLPTVADYCALLLEGSNL
jgi:hypothetical protein